jgi:sugar phosphate isomerase/epimerase
MTARRIGIGIDTFAYHRHFGECTTWETPLGHRWTIDDFLARATGLGVDAVSLQTLFLPELTPEAIDTLRGKLGHLEPVVAWGHPDGLQGGTNGARLVEARAVLPAAKALGCKIVRVACGNHFFFATPPDERRARLVPMLETLADDAAALGLTLAVENHADFRMADVVAMIEDVGGDHVGICFDTGNAVRVGDDLPTAARLAAPHVKMVHIKDMIVLPESVGDPTRFWPTVPLGRGEFDLPGFVAILRDARFGGTLFVELANMHPDFPDEDAGVAEGVAYLKALLGR